MKRAFHERDLDSITTMANCLMLLSQGRETIPFPPFDAMMNNANISPSRVFECKTCNRQFPSFQALGGHRASHKKPRLMGGDGSSSLESQSPPAKPKTHECSICGLEFAIGQALGGHMRRHRASLNEDDHHHHQNQLLQAPLSPPPSGAEVLPVLKRSSSSSKRVLCLDLNLTPYENDLDLRLGKPAAPPAMVDCL